MWIELAGARSRGFALRDLRWFPREVGPPTHVKFRRGSRMIITQGLRSPTCSTSSKFTGGRYRAIARSIDVVGVGDLRQISRRSGGPPGNFLGVKGRKFSTFRCRRRWDPRTTVRGSGGPTSRKLLGGHQLNLLEISRGSRRPDLTLGNCLGDLLAEPRESFTGFGPGRAPTLCENHRGLGPLTGRAHVLPGGLRLAGGEDRLSLIMSAFVS